MSYTSAIANFSNDADGDQILNSQENNIGTDPRVVTTRLKFIMQCQIVYP